MTEKIEITDDLEKVTTAVTAITATEAGIADLVLKYDKVIFPVETSKGMIDAKKARAEIRAPRFTIENLRKEAKAPVIALGKSIQAVAADLTAQIRQIEDPIVAQIEVEEKRVADAEQKVIDDELKRIEEIQSRISGLFETVETFIRDGNTDTNFIANCIDAYKAKPVDGSFVEFRDDAQKTWDAGLVLLEAHLEKTIESNAAAVKAAADAEELRVLREEKEKRDAADAKEEKRKADIKAELERVAAAVKPIEEQLDSVGITGVEAESVKDAITGQPYQTAPQVDEETQHIETLQPDYVVPYPGSNSIVETLAMHYETDIGTAVEWLHKVAHEIGEKA